MKAVVVVALLAAPAAAESRLCAGYVMGPPISGDAGGADHAAALHWEQAVGARLDLGLTVEVGHAPGNAEQSLTRFAVMPTVGASGVWGDFVVRGDLAFGWQLADGETKVAGIPVRGTESRGLRAELGVSGTADVAAHTALRARAGLSVDGLYPHALESETSVGPFVEVALVLTP